MINYIKNRINKYVEKKLRELLNKEKAVAQTHFDYGQLNQLFGDISFYVPMSTYSISPSTITHILNDIIINDRTKIIEFGSGVSTIYIAKLLKTYNIKADFYSVDSDETWLEVVKKQLAILGLDEFVTIIIAPVKTVKATLVLDQQELWYDFEIIEDSLKNTFDFDLILVDGPFGGLTRNARYSAVPFLRNKLADSYSIFLDDIQRQSERNIALKWQQLLNCNLKYFQRYAVLTKNQNFISKPYKL